MNALRESYAQEIDQILAKYPDDQKRSAVMPLLFVAMRKDGYVKKQDLEDIGEIIGTSSTEVASILGFYTLFHDQPEGLYRIQVCNDLPCALRGADTFLDGLCDNLGIRPGETTEDGVVTLEAVMCLAACDKAPMFQVQTPYAIAYHEKQTIDSTMQMVESWRAEEGTHA